MLSILNLIIDTVGGIIVGVFLARFLFQILRINYRDPIVSAVMQITNPLVLPLRKVTPGLFGLDLASFLAALLISFSVSEILIFFTTGHFLNPLIVILAALLGMASIIISAIIVIFIIVAIASFIAPHSRNPALDLMRSVIEPILSPIRRVIPPIGGLDLSMIPALILLQIIKFIVLSGVTKLGVNPFFIIGL